jgi:hypothetical protein
VSHGDYGPIHPRFPIIDVPNPWLFTVKIVAIVGDVYRAGTVYYTLEDARAEQSALSQSHDRARDLVPVAIKAVDQKVTSNRQRLTHAGMSAVTAGDERSRARVQAAVCALDPRHDMIAALLEPDEFRLALDRDAGASETIEQQSLVLLLRKDERVRLRADAGAHLAKHEARNRAARDPQIRR